ncbi:MAG: OPT/YSL family transporter [Eggerthellaceae bacterium]|nr:OPT/YSL family transporter [Eggerthellaceae bacterium]
MNLPKGQLTARGVAIGVVGCVVITAASAYTALKMGALPWPIVFAAIVALFFLKALNKGHADLHEANVTHTVMSAGSMVAGGLAFTIPGAWMLGYTDQTDWSQLLAVALGGTILGSIATIPIRKRFIAEEPLEFPIGQAAAQTLLAGETGGSTGRRLFGALGLAGIYTWLRDGIGLLPTVFFSGISFPGVSFGLYNSPLMMSMGFLVGTSSVLVWFAGALLGSFGVIAGGAAAGLWDTATGQGIASSLGMGAMMGCGLGVVLKLVAGKAWAALKGRSDVDSRKADRSGEGASDASAGHVSARRFKMTAGLIALCAAAVALVLCLVLGFSPLVSVIVVALSFVSCAMAAQSCGQTGIDPMEIFGLIVLLFVAAFSGSTQVQLFYVAGVIAVACGLAGDVMYDFKAGRILGTDWRAQWIGQVIGAVVGALVSVAVMMVLLAAYGADAFGPQGSFVAAQASVVATMVSGIPSVPAFLVGLAAGMLLYFAKAPAMMLGLGIYLPFYMSFAAFLGTMVKLAYNAVCKRRRARAGEGYGEEARMRDEQTGLVVASGIIGGESVVGVLVALFAIVAGVVAG